MAIELDKDVRTGELVPSLRKPNQWYICITENDLEVKLRGAFQAAKKAGREIDVTFTGEPI